MAEKTEPPTPRRLRKLRDQGDVPLSGALSQSLGFLAGAALLPSAAGAAFVTLAELVRGTAQGQPLSVNSLGAAVLALCLPILAAVAFTSALASVAQSGGLFAPQRLSPSLDRLNVLNGLRSLFGAQRLFTLARSFVASVALLALAWHVVHTGLGRLVVASGELGRASSFASVDALALTRGMAAIALALGALDLLVVRRSFSRKHRMSHDEVRREHKESEGDPELKAARRRAHQEVLNQASIHAVRNASVVIVNPTHLATALRYDDAEDEAPRVLAHGDGELARRMIEAAQAWGVPVVRDIPLARALAELETGDEIPEALYEAVAEILRSVWEAEGNRPEPAP